jgi:hypothetical protein
VDLGFHPPLYEFFFLIGVNAPLASAFDQMATTIDNRIENLLALIRTQGLTKA